MYAVSVLVIVFDCSEMTDGRLPHRKHISIKSCHSGLLHVPACSRSERIMLGMFLNYTTRKVKAYGAGHGAVRIYKGNLKIM